jgi:hypothetical protein
MSTGPAHRRLPTAAIVAVLLGMSCAATLVLHTSRAAFTASTVNSGNRFTAATVELRDDDRGRAAFTAKGLLPGDSAGRCVLVTYTGTAPAAVKLFVDPDTYAGDLGQYLELTIEVGKGGRFDSCAGFIKTETVYSGKLAALAAASTDYEGGVGAFTPAHFGTSVTYRFTYRVCDNNGGQGGTVAADFVWEARNS